MNTSRRGPLVSVAVGLGLVIIAAVAQRSVDPGASSLGRGVDAVAGERGVGIASAIAPSADLGTLTPADAALVKRQVSVVGAPAGSRLTAIKAPGARVWETFNADVSVGSDTAIAKRHDLIVVLLAYPTPVPDPDAGLPGTPPSKISGLSFIIDSTDGRLFEESGVPVGAPNGHTPLPSALGTPTLLTVT